MATDTIPSKNVRELYQEGGGKELFVWGRAGSERFKFPSLASVVRKTTNNL